MADFVLITGCSSGIGLHLAQRLQQEGFCVLATARKNNDVQHLITAGLTAHQLDLDDENSIEQAVVWALEQSNGKLYGLINNGAYGQTGALEDLPTQALREQFNTNLFGWHHLIRQILPAMLKENQGRIIQISSLFWDWLHSNTGELTRPVSSHLRDTPTRSGWNYGIPVSRLA